jgi:hypothetical protein
MFPLSRAPTSLAGATRQATMVRREADTGLGAAIFAVAVYLLITDLGLGFDGATVLATVQKFLGPSAPLFAGATAFLLWVVAALVVEITGMTRLRRGWRGIDAALFYLENAAPFVGLLECFISIVKALLGYAAAGVSQTAQSLLISNIAIALGASAAGCFVALFAHSLRAILAHRTEPS